MEIIQTLFFLVFISFLLYLKFRPDQEIDFSKLGKPAREEHRVMINFVICNNDSDVPPEDMWYRWNRWGNQRLLKMDTTWSSDWRLAHHVSEIEVAGLHIANRREDLLSMVDRSDFKITLEREPDNPVDKNAIKVIGTATVKGLKRSRQIGYLPKEFAANLVEEKDMDARPALLELPNEQGNFLNLGVKVLIRSVRYRKKKEKERIAQEKQPTRSEWDGTYSSVKVEAYSKNSQRST